MEEQYENMAVRISMAHRVRLSYKKMKWLKISGTNFAKVSSFCIKIILSL
jgi:hypothetical protein